MGSNREKSYITTAILEKLPILKGNNFFLSQFDGSNNISAECRFYKSIRRVFKLQMWGKWPREKRITTLRIYQYGIIYDKAIETSFEMQKSSIHDKLWLDSNYK